MKIAEVLRSPRPGARLEPLPADQANCPFKIGDRVQPDPTHWKSGNQNLLKRAGLYTDTSVVKTVVGPCERPECGGTVVGIRPGGHSCVVKFDAGLEDFYAVAELRLAEPVPAALDPAALKAALAASLAACPFQVGDRVRPSVQWKQGNQNVLKAPNRWPVGVARSVVGPPECPQASGSVISVRSSAQVDVTWDSGLTDYFSVSELEAATPLEVTEVSEREAAPAEEEVPSLPRRPPPPCPFAVGDRVRPNGEWMQGNQNLLQGPGRWPRGVVRSVVGPPEHPERGGCVVGIRSGGQQVDIKWDMGLSDYYSVRELENSPAPPQRARRGRGTRGGAGGGAASVPGGRARAAAARLLAVGNQKVMTGRNDWPDGVARIAEGTRCVRPAAGGRVLGFRGRLHVDVAWEANPSSSDYYRIEELELDPDHA